MMAAPLVIAAGAMETAADQLMAVSVMATGAAADAAAEIVVVAAAAVQ